MKLEVLWRQLVGTGAEHLVLNMDGTVRADSMAVGEIESIAYRIHYLIECDSGWNLQRVQIEDLLGGKALTLRRGENGSWSDEQLRVLAEMEGCSEVDIMITPFTNTLPVRRLHLRPGESSEIAVAYVGLPGLQLSRIEQRYTCRSTNENGAIYRYESLKSGFTAELQVDTDGLVVEYPNILTMDAKRPVQNG